ncbi:MAG: hypothetical protein SFU25_01065, partial [Candidatus Caenarcaniphilales bacterium]|nr:hypothetical protein [Candidatus Caenarcaniphilales bacterium]
MALRILEEWKKGNDWFLRGKSTSPADSKHPIYYPLSVCYALLYYIQKHPEENVEEILNQCIEAIQSQKPFYKNDFLQINPYVGDQGQYQGFCIIDKSKGCFPLVLYDQNTAGQDSKSQKRKHAFV